MAVKYLGKTRETFGKILNQNVNVTVKAGSVIEAASLIEALLLTTKRFEKVPEKVAAPVKRDKDKAPEKKESEIK